MVSKDWLWVGDIMFIYTTPHTHCLTRLGQTVLQWVTNTPWQYFQEGGIYDDMKVPLLEIGLIVIKQSRRPSPVLLLRDSKTCESPPK